LQLENTVFIFALFLDLNLYVALPPCLLPVVYLLLYMFVSHSLHDADFLFFSSHSKIFQYHDNRDSLCKSKQQQLGELSKFHFFAIFKDTSTHYTSNIGRLYYYYYYFK